MSDINLVFSGGVQNTGQKDSLGGFPSALPPGDGKNNLFDNVTAKQTTQGWTDYRCMYVFNDNDNIRFDLTLYISYLSEIGATVSLGLLLQNEVQSIRFTDVPTGGTFTISVQGLKSDTITWNDNPTILAANMETAIKAFTDCSVTSSGSNTYQITFKGRMSNKALTTLSITDNALTPGSINPVIAKVTMGSPINTIAPDTGDQKTPPTGIPFTTPLTPGVLIGTLFPSEGFPVWVKRIVPPGFEAVEEDGFELILKASGTLT
jgi:hypothetical protein